MMFKHLWFCTLFAVGLGCNSSSEREGDNLYSGHDLFVHSNLVIEADQLAMIRQNHYGYFDSLTVAGQFSADTMDQLVEFRSQCQELIRRVYLLRSWLISTVENVDPMVADTLSGQFMFNLNSKVSIPDDSLVWLMDALDKVHDTGNNLPFRKDTELTHVRPRERYSPENDVMVGWTEDAFNNITLKEALNSFDILLVKICRFELEIILRIRAGFDGAPWRQS